jgi:hypothetical protein
MKRFYLREGGRVFEEGRALWSSGASSYFSSLDMACSSCVSVVLRAGGCMAVQHSAVPIAVACSRRCLLAFGP